MPLAREIVASPQRECFISEHRFNAKRRRAAAPSASFHREPMVSPWNGRD
jgi:hypothetical protein